MKYSILALACGAAIFCAPAQAATLIAVFDGNDCTGSFSQCFATQTGTNVEGGALSSPVVIKYNGSAADNSLDPFEVDEVSTNFPSVSGSEFVLNFDEATGIVTFTYSPDADDPNIHYFSIKQGSEYALFYDANPIFSDSIDLNTVGFSAGTDSFSHLTFFNSGTAVPEPGTWAMMLFGFGVIGFAMRRRRQTSGGRMRVRFAF